MESGVNNNIVAWTTLRGIIEIQKSAKRQGSHPAEPTRPTRSAVERRASIHSQRCLPQSIPTVTLLFVIIVCSSPAHVRNFYIPVFFFQIRHVYKFFFQNGRF